MNRPDENAISRLLHHFPQQMLMMAQAGASSDDAALLYKHALAQPGMQTVLNMVAEHQIAVNGPWLPSHPQLVTGVDLQSKQLLVLKLLPLCSYEQKIAAQSERHAIETLRLDSLREQSALVSCCLVEVCISVQHAKALDMGTGQYQAVKMPRFAAGLVQLPQMSEDILYEGALRLESALQEMYAAKILHAM